MATDHLEGPMMVLAGPGSGKTTVITYRIKNLIETYHVPPGKILVITFTKAASEEMKNRFMHMVGGKFGQVSFGTFHSFFFRVIRSYYRYTVEDILKEEEKRELFRKLIRSEQISCEDEEELCSQLEMEFALVKNNLSNIQEHMQYHVPKEQFCRLYEKFEAYKKEQGKIDFDDMLLLCYQLICENQQVLNFWQNQYEYILIDEFQDINRVQYECMKLMAKPRHNLFVVGDDDQSIYNFRGASPQFLLSFPKDFENTKSIILDVNYRSTDCIIQTCNKVIAQNKFRYAKKIMGTNKQGSVPVLLRSEDTNKEARLIADKIKKFSAHTAFRNMAIIYRTNIQSRAFVDAFMDMNIPFQIKDEAPSIYEHWIAKDITAYLKLALDRNENDALYRIINKPSRYISKGTLAIAKKEKSSLLNNLYTSKQLKGWQTTRIEELIFYLNAVKKRSTFEAFRYIRNAIGYDKYLRDYANFRRVTTQGMFEILEEVQESAKNYENISDYLNHIENVMIETKNNKIKKNSNYDGVTLSTMHSVKGLEYDVVFLATVVEGVVPHEKSVEESELEEECRLLYVGMTRARNKLYLSVVKVRNEQEVKPSRFLKVLLSPEGK